MKTLILAAIRCSLMFTAVAALSVVCPASVQAVPTTYQYTGNHFTSAEGPYTTSDFVTVMLRLEGPLPPNMPLTLVTPLAFSVSDGVQTITSPNAGGLFSFATGPTGMITLWEVLISTLSGQGFIFTIQDFRGAIDQGFLNEPAGLATNHDAPGTWTTAPVPDAGSSLALLSLSLTALGVAARRFKRAAT